MVEKKERDKCEKGRNKKGRKEGDKDNLTLMKGFSGGKYNHTLLKEGKKRRMG